MMKRFVLLALLFPLAAWAQGNNFGGGNIPFVGAPTGSCSPTQLAINTSNGNQYNCPVSTWSLVSGGSGSTTFDAIGSGKNVTAAMEVGAGSTFTFDIGYTIAGSAGAVPTAKGLFGFNTTNNRPVFGDGSITQTLLAVSDVPATPAATGYVFDTYSAPNDVFTAVATPGVKCYPFGGSGGNGCDAGAAVATTPAIGSKPSGNKLCAANGDAGCTNSADAITTLQYFAQTYTIPANVLANGVVVRTCWVVLYTTSGTAPTVNVGLTANVAGTPVVLYTTQAAGIGMTNSLSNLRGEFCFDTMGLAAVSGSSATGTSLVAVPAIAGGNANISSNHTAGQPTMPTNASIVLSFGIFFGTNTTGNNWVLESVRGPF